jgi:hypothetical protein
MIKVTSLVILTLMAGVLHIAQAEEKRPNRSVTIAWRNTTKFPYQITFKTKDECIIDPGKKDTFTVRPQIDFFETIVIDGNCSGTAVIAWKLVRNGNYGGMMKADIYYTETPIRNRGWKVNITPYITYAEINRTNIKFQAFCSNAKLHCLSSGAIVEDISYVTSLSVTVVPTALEIFMSQNGVMRIP